MGGWGGHVADGALEMGSTALGGKHQKGGRSWGEGGI